MLVIFHCVCPQGRASPFTDSITGTTNRNRSVKQFQHKTNPISRDCTTNAKHMFIARVLDFSIRVCVCLVSVSVTDTTGSFEKLQVATHANQSHHSCFQEHMERLRKTRTHVTTPSLSTCPNGTHHFTQHMFLRLPWRVIVQMRCIKKKRPLQQEAKTKKKKLRWS